MKKKTKVQRVTIKKNKLNAGIQMHYLIQLYIKYTFQPYKLSDDAVQISEVNSD